MGYTSEAVHSNSSLKEQKEAFVSGHEGTTPQEIMLICATAPVGYWLSSTLLRQDSILCRLLTTRPITMEAVVFWIPMILCQSSLIYPWGVTYMGLQLLVVAGLEWFGTQPTRENSTKNDEDASKARHPSHPYLTHYRSSLLYLTFVAILAVDFPFFPRRLAKTETHGYGLMDVGAASFVLAAGLVSPRAKEGYPRKRKMLTSKLALRLLPLVVMGLLRLATHKGLEYQEHASEYGVHWNFFFTLALLPLIVALLPGPSLIIPLLTVCTYQFILSMGQVQEWIEEAPRTCEQEQTFSTLCFLFVANREGILGCIGYTAIYMLGEWIGETSLWSDKKSSSFLWQTWALSIGVWVGLVQGLGIHVSRRSTNASFCFWILVVNLPLLGLMQELDERQATTHKTATLVSQAVNRHGLVCFIVANLLTGAVNLTVNTLEATDTMAFVVLLGYLTAVGTLATVLEAISSYQKATPKQKNQIKAKNA